MDDFDNNMLIDVLRTLLEAGADLELIDETNILALSAGGPVDIFNYIQQHTFMTSGEIKFVEKVRIIQGFVSPPISQRQSVISSYLGGPDFQANVALHRDDNVTKRLFEDICWSFINPNSTFSTDAAADLINTMLSAGMSLHTLEGTGHTSLQSIFDDCSWSIPRKLWRLRKTLKKWLDLLVRLGIDLQAYGKEESLLYKRERMALNFDLRLQRRFRKILGFKYGPRVEDWELWIFEPSDKYAGEFWYLIENPILEIPGAWVD